MHKFTDEELKTHDAAIWNEAAEICGVEAMKHSYKLKMVLKELANSMVAKAEENGDG